jgi:transposase
MLYARPLTDSGLSSHLLAGPVSTAMSIKVDPYAIIGGMRAYSEDLRKKIVAAIERGMPKAQAARTFSVSLSSVKRYVRSVRQGESLTPKKSPGRPRIVDQKAQLLLEKDVEERPSATVSQRRRFLEHITGTDMSDATVRRLMKRLGFSQKNGQWGRWNETNS